MKHAYKVLIVALTCLLLSSCNAAGELLDVDTPVRLWTGKVVRSDGETAVPGAIVVIRGVEDQAPAAEPEGELLVQEEGEAGAAASAADEPKELLFSGTTSSAGNFSIPYLWHEHWKYSVTAIYHDGVHTLAGSLEARPLTLSDQVDIVPLHEPEPPAAPAPAQ